MDSKRQTNKIKWKYWIETNWKLEEHLSLSLSLTLAATPSSSSVNLFFF